MPNLSFMDFARRVDALSVSAGRKRFSASCEYAYDFCHDFVRPPCDRSPRSWADLARALDGWSACDEAIEGAKAAWIEYQRWTILEHGIASLPKERRLRELDYWLAGYDGSDGRGKATN